MNSRPGPLVTIVTPSLNRSGLIEQTIRSVRSQSYVNVEHIVIDGGSTDGTVDLLRAAATSYRLRWISEPDGGMYAAINKGLRLAEGDIVAYLNTDDLYFPWTVQEVVDAFATRPDADLVYGDVLSVDDRTHAQRIHWQYPFNTDYIRRSGFLAQPAVFWRRKVVEDAGGFDESLRFVADCDLWMRLGGHANFQRIDEVLAIERDHDGTLRSEQADALEAELRAVRGRYVRAEGMAHRIRVFAHRVRLAMRRRAYWLRFALAARTPTRDRRGPWARFCATPGLAVSRAAVIVHQIPVIGPAFEARVLAGTPYQPDRVGR